MANRVFLNPKAIAELKAGRHPHFDYAVKSAGSTADFNVYYATSLGNKGKEVADAVLPDAPLQRDCSPALDRA